MSSFEMRVEYLNMIQGVIARIAGNGATLKNYCVTLATAVCGLAVTIQQPMAAMLALLLVLICWGLDARYLHLERGYRRLFDEVRGEDWNTQPSFSLRPGKLTCQGLGEAICSWSILIFYLPLALVVLFVGIIIGFSNGSPA